jgi:hypothetical protein
MCLTCGMPHVVAPDLVGWVDEKKSHCYWKKQPGTAEELERAIAVLNAQELECHRYAGDNLVVLGRVPAQCCDQVLPRGAPSTEISTDLKPPRFALLEEGFFFKIWKRVRTRGC